MEPMDKRNLYLKFNLVEVQGLKKLANSSDKQMYVE